MSLQNKGNKGYYLNRIEDINDQGWFVILNLLQLSDHRGDLYMTNYFNTLQHSLLNMIFDQFVLLNNADDFNKTQFITSHQLFLNKVTFLRVVK